MIYVPLSRPLIPQYLRVLLSILFNSIGIQCLDQKNLDSKGRSIDLVYFLSRWVNPQGMLSCYILYNLIWYYINV